MSSDQAAVNQNAFDSALLNTLVTTIILSTVYLSLFHSLKYFKPKYYHRNPSHPNDQNLFDWLWKTIRYPTTKILWRFGYDAYVSLSIIKLYIILILVFSFYSILVLIPINATGHNQYLPDNVTLIDETNVVNETIGQAQCVCTCVSYYNVTTFPVNGTALITLSNIYNSEEDGGKIYAHGISVIWNTIWTWVLLFLAWRRFRDVRQTFRSEPKPHNYTVKLYGYPHKKWTEEKLKAYIESIFGVDSVYAIHLVPCGPGFNKLGALRKKRLSIVQDIEGFKEELAQEPDNPKSKQNLGIAMERLNKVDTQISGLVNKTDPWAFTFSEKAKLKKGCCNPITYFCARRKGRGKMNLEYVHPPDLFLPPDISPDHENTTNTAFVTFRKMRDARLCAQSYLGRNPHFHCDPAPVRSDVRWQNFKAPEHHAKTKSFELLGVCLYVALSVFWFIPIAFAASLTSLTALGNIAPFLKPITDKLETIPVIRGFVEGLFPQLVIIIFFALLLPIIQKIGDICWHPDSNSGIDILVMQAYFAFNVVNIYLGGIIANTFLAIYTQVALIVANPFSIVSILANSLPQQSNFFLNFVLANGLVKACSSMSRIPGAIIYAIKDKMGHTRREKYMMLEAEVAQHGASLATHNLIMLLVFTYSTITPLLLPIALLYFVCFYIAEKYSTLFHAKQVNESGGWYWPVAFSQMCLALGLYHLVMLGVFIGVKFTFGIITTILCFLSTIFYWYFITQEWRPLTFYSSLSDLAPVSPPDIGQLPEDYTGVYKHPAISPLELVEHEWNDHIDEALNRQQSSVRPTRARLNSPNSPSAQA